MLKECGCLRQFALKSVGHVGTSCWYAAGFQSALSGMRRELSIDLWSGSGVGGWKVERRLERQLNDSDPKTRDARSRVLPNAVYVSLPITQAAWDRHSII